MDKEPIVIVGGGIAGTTCAQTLAERVPVSTKIVIVTVSHLVKVTKNIISSGKNLDSFDVVEVDTTKDNCLGANVDIVIGSVIGIIHEQNTLIYTDPRITAKPNRLRLKYFKLCICTGAKPKSFPLKCPIATINDRILFIRDTQTVESLQRKLETARRVVIVGNGGIATELAYVIKKCQIVWVIREDSIGATFFDAGAAKFLLDSLKADKNDKSVEIAFRTKSFRYSSMALDAKMAGQCSSGEGATIISDRGQAKFGSALGPDWMQDLELIGSCDYTKEIKDNLIIERSASFREVMVPKQSEWPIEVLLTNGKTFMCDLIVCAVGVEPNNDWNKLIDHNQVVGGYLLDTSQNDGGILVDNQMRTSIHGVYAAGDVISCEKWPKTNLWHQMRLWTQARQMGYYAALCIWEHILGRDPSIYFNFDCFTHVTKFFNYKVVLLGRFNGQNLNNYEIMVRINPDQDYIKLIIKEGLIQGAVIVGETALEETFENIIHNQIDVSRYGNELLDGTVDIDDYFD